MATATINRISNEIKLEPGVPQTFALKFVTGKNLGDSQFPPYLPRVLFTAVDDRRLYLSAEEASEFEHQLVDLNVRPADFVTVTKIKHGGRGGGFSYRVELARETRLEADLRQSIANAEAAKRVAPQRAQTATAAPGERAAAAGSQKRENGEVTTVAQQPIVPQIAPHPQAGALSPNALRFMGAYKDSIDVLIESQGYARSRGVLLDITCESVRCLAATIMIGGAR